MRETLFSVIAAAALLFSVSQPAITPRATDAHAEYPHTVIAHAGGIIDNYAGSNSLEALTDSARRGYKFIEVDIIKTTDGAFVLAHDWSAMSNRVPLAPDKPVDLAAFMSRKIYGKYTPVTLDGLLSFLDKNPDVYIITDTKDRDYSSLEYIAGSHPDYASRFIPQVYMFEDYYRIKSLGFDRIIVTVYIMPYEIKMSPETIAARAKELGVFAVTIPYELLTPEYAARLDTDGTDYFTHTVNTVEAAEALFDMGIKGVYTDEIAPSGASVITEYDDRFGVELGELRDAVGRLDSGGRALLADCQIYKLGGELMLNKGAAEFIYGDVMCGSFQNADGRVYLPFSKMAAFLGVKNVEYDMSGRFYRFDFGGGSYKIPVGMPSFEVVSGGNTRVVEVSGATTLYRDIIFSEETLFEKAFGCEITVIDGKYIVVTRQQTQLDYSQIAGSLFAS